MQPTERAFLLLKPDAIKGGYERAIEHEIIGSGLLIEEGRNLVLSPTTVRSLWTEYTEDRHPLTFAFLDRYLCNGESRILSVTGKNAFETSRKIKRNIRSRYSSGVFANLVHAAETRTELARQARLLKVSGTWLADQDPSDEDSPLRPSGLPITEVQAGLKAIDEIWTQLESGGGKLPEPEPVRLNHSRDCDHGVFFGVDSFNSVDSAVAAVKWSLPGASLLSALHLAIYAGRASGHLIALGDSRSTEACVEKLKSYGIRNCRVQGLNLSTQPDL